MKKKTHKVIRRKDGVSDYTACDTSRSYLDPATDDLAQVTCSDCLRALGKS